MTTLLLIPGLVSDDFVWRSLQPLRPAVVACITQQASIPEMARDLLTRHPGRLILAGHSLGGRVALEMARMAPGRIAGIALLNTGTHPKREGEEAISVI